MTTPSFLLKFKRTWTIGLQLAMVALANIAAFALRFDGMPPAWAMAACVQMLPWLLVIRGLTFIPFKLYEGLWRYTSIYDLRSIVAAVAASSGVFVAADEEPARSGASTRARCS